jgi:3-isopropylmalate dehydrogenase
MMHRRRIAWLQGDAPGAELVAAARRVFDVLAPGLAEHEVASIGWEAWLEQGESVPAATLQLCSAADAVLIGALARGPDDSDPKRLAARLGAAPAGPEPVPAPLLRLCRALGLGVQVTECKLYPSHLATETPFELAVYTPELSTLAGGVRVHPVDESCLRELLQGQHAADWQALPAGAELELTLGVLSRDVCRRALREAFGWAQRHEPAVVSVVSGRCESPVRPGMLRTEARRMAREYLDVQLREVLASTLCGPLLTRPSSYGALVCSPEVSAQVTALAAYRAGGPALAATAFLGESRGCFLPLEPADQSYAGQGRANPVAVFQAVRMMLGHLQQEQAAARLDAAIAELLAGGPRTLDRGGDASTAQVTDYVLAQVAQSEK